MTMSVIRKAYLPAAPTRLIEGHAGYLTLTLTLPDPTPLGKVRVKVMAT